MKKRTKWHIHSFFAWDYAREAEYLDSMSRKGWQLCRGGCFCNRFYRDESEVYRHQLDFRRSGDIDSMSRYIETFTEQGWEYVNSLNNGWHYFRKPYDSTLPEAEYRIYTDTDSVGEMKRRWTRGMGFVLLCILAIFVLRAVDFAVQPDAPSAVYAVIFLLEGVILGRGYLLMRRNRERSGRIFRNAPFLMLLILLLGFSCATVLEDKRPTLHGMMSAEYMNPTISADLEDAVNYNTLHIRYRDFYYVSLKGSVEAPITVSIVRDDSGEVVFEKRVAAGDSLEQIVKREQLMLYPGSYTIYLSDFAGGAEFLAIDFE